MTVGADDGRDDAPEAERNRLRHVLDSLAEAVVLLDAEGCVVDANRAALALDRRVLADIAGRPWSEAWPTAAGTPLETVARAALLERTAGRAEHLHRSIAHARDLWIEMRAYPSAGGGVTLMYRDITDVKATERQLERRVAERTDALRALYDKAPVPLHSQSPDGTLISVSDRWLELMGYADRSEVLGRRGADFLTRDSAARLLKQDWPALIQAGQTDDVEYQVVKRSGEVADVLISSRIERDAGGAILRSTGAVVDITARRRAEAQLRQAQKMEAIGQLTGGVAHDFNNLLTAVIGSLELLRRRPGDADRQAKLVDNALAGAERGAKLTRSLLAFARTQAVTLAPVPVNEAVRAVADLLGRSLGPNVSLRLALDGDAGAALADVNQLENALLNLGLNARDAMPDGGVLTISTRRSAPDQVDLTVGDTGVGMSPEVADRAFEPFFTTKPTGEGTGLGLAQVYGFARQSGGTVRIESAPGEGARVRLTLRGADASNPRVEASAPPLADDEAPPAKVLVVDDDAEVRAALTASVEELGFMVEAAADGAQGLARLDTGAFDLVLLDYAMPGMTGAECARRMLEARPGLPIVFATGYADMEALSRAVGGAPILRKPFLLSELGAALRSALDRPAASPSR